MRLFKANYAAQSEEDRVRDLRLTSIASRYRARPDISLVPDAERQPEVQQEPQRDVEPESQPELLLDPEAPPEPGAEQKSDES